MTTARGRGRKQRPGQRLTVILRLTLMGTRARAVNVCRAGTALRLCDEARAMHDLEVAAPETLSNRSESASGVRVCRLQAPSLRSQAPVGWAVIPNSSFLIPNSGGWAGGTFKRLTL